MAYVHGIGGKLVPPNLVGINGPQWELAVFDYILSEIEAVEQGTPLAPWNQQSDRVWPSKLVGWYRLAAKHAGSTSKLAHLLLHEC